MKKVKKAKAVHLRIKKRKLNLKVKELPVDDRPREKLLLRGAHNLSNSELIAILLRTGTKGRSVIDIARELISKHENISNLALKSVDSISQTPGIGKDKAATLAAAFEISKRIKVDERWYSGKKVTGPSDIAKIFVPLLRDELKEKFITVCLNSANKIIRYVVISVGNLNASIVHPREVFKAAIDNNSASIILLHNHPSGNTEPSNEDIKVTRTLKEAGKIMAIEVLDHIIIAGDRHISMVDKGII